MLLWSLLPAVFAAELATSLASYRNSLIEANELFDAKLAQSVRILAALVESHLDEGDVPPNLAVNGLMVNLPGRDTDLATSQGHVYESKVAFQAIAADGTMLLRTGNAPEHPLAPLAAGFADVGVGTEVWRVFTLIEDGRYFVAAERADIRRELAAETAASALMPLLLSLPLLTCLIVLIVNRSARSLRTLAANIETRPADRLDPFPSDQVPQEVVGLVQAMNRLLQRVDTLIERERRFAADAAHELRTPISALKIHAQNLQRYVDGADMLGDYERLLRGFDRCERLIEQLLDLTRMERLEEPSVVDLAQLAQDVIAELAPAALREGREFTLRAQRTLVRGHPVLLGALIRNLVDNALRHGGGEVTVDVVPAPVATLSVLDGGAGLESAALHRVLDRYHRENEATPGTGLGLSIAKRIADAHGAQMVLQNGLQGGLKVSVTF